MSDFETEKDSYITLRCMFCGAWQIDYLKENPAAKSAALREVTLHANICVFGEGLVDLLKDELA